MFKKLFFLLALAIFICAGTAHAHFGMIIPQASQVDRPGILEMLFMFSHPFENHAMDLVKPVQAGVSLAGQKTDLMADLKKESLDGKSAWRLAYNIKRPGDYYFYMVPQAYWEPEEDCYIIHYTKVCVSALGAEVGWDQPVGLAMEIMPLTRPYGLYAGNSFTGQVQYQGKALPGCTVEVEYYNPDGAKKAPTSSHITQEVRSDPNGVFSFSMPWKGWWGFAALHTDPNKTMDKDGKAKEVEQGGVFWIYVH